MKLQTHAFLQPHYNKALKLCGIWLCTVTETSWAENKRRYFIKLKVTSETLCLQLFLLRETPSIQPYATPLCVGMDVVSMNTYDVQCDLVQQTKQGVE